MTGAAFTPGPWEASDPGDYTDCDGQSRVITGNDRRIAVVHWSANSPEHDATAHLIAASPMLYEALEAALQDIEDDLRWANGSDVMMLFARRNHAERALDAARGEVEEL